MGNINSINNITDTYELFTDGHVFTYSSSLALFLAMQEKRLTDAFDYDTIYALPENGLALVAGRMNVAISRGKMDSTRSEAIHRLLM